MARSERIKVKGIQKEMSPQDIELYTLALWLQSKRIRAEGRQNAAKAKAKRRRLDRKREQSHER